jgi:oligo-1,6-glucosidase
LTLLRPRSRDNARTPMQWSPQKGAGFTAGVPWIGINPNYIEVNAEDQADDPDSVLEYYRRLGSFRRQHRCLSLGDYEPIPGKHSEVLTYKRFLSDESLFITVNLSSRGHSLVNEPRQVGPQLFSNYPAGAGRPKYLRPWEARICLWRES